MNPLSDKQLEKMLRSTPPAGDVDRAVQGVLAQAERDGLVDVAYAPVDSPFGRLLVARTDRGVVRLALPKHRGHQQTEDEVLEDLARYVSPRVLESPKRLDEERRELEEYFEHKRDHFDVPVDWALTPAGVPEPGAARGGADSIRRDPHLRPDRHAGGQLTRLPRSRDRVRPQRDSSDRPLPPSAPVRRRRRQLRWWPRDEAGTARSRGRAVVVYLLAL